MRARAGARRRKPITWESYSSTFSIRQVVQAVLLRSRAAPCPRSPVTIRGSWSVRSVTSLVVCNRQSPTTSPTPRACACRSVGGREANSAMATQRPSAAAAGKASQPQHRYRKQPSKPKPKRGSRSCWWIFGEVLLLSVALGLAVREYRHRYPAEQRCPPEDDRFHDHCMEGRKHYLLNLDWDCDRICSSNRVVRCRAW